MGTSGLSLWQEALLIYGVVFVCFMVVDFIARRWALVLWLTTIMLAAWVVKWALSR